jgi:hypothetical protein
LLKVVINGTVKWTSNGRQGRRKNRFIRRRNALVVAKY